jgi:hypothetical protein
LLQGLQKTWARNLRWAWWVSCSSSSAFRSSKGRNIRAPSQVHQGHCEKFKMEDSKAMATPEYDYSSWCRRGRWARGPQGVSEHDRVTTLVDGDEATSNSQYLCALVFKHLQWICIGKVFVSYSWLRPLVLRVFLFGSSWIFGRGFCRVLVG